jgi:hypothetical protein
MTRWTLLGVLCMAGVASADTIRLKNGGTLEGVVLKEGDGAVVVRLKYATVTLDRSDIESIDKKAPDPSPGAAPTRLPRWDRCIEAVAARPWAGELRQIPATVIDKGILKYVPYMSHKSGNTEFNLYGDPDDPAGIEIGVTRELLKSAAAKAECLEVITALLSDPKDVAALRSLNLKPGKTERDGLTFEVTPETAEDAYDGWWISVYNVKLLDEARATEEELRRISVTEAELEREEEAERERAKKELAERKGDEKKKAEPRKIEPGGYFGFNPYLFQKQDVRLARRDAAERRPALLDPRLPPAPRRRLYARTLPLGAVIDGATGEVILRDGTRLGRDLTLDAFVWTSPLYTQARRGEGAAGWTSWHLDLELEKGGRFQLCLRFKDDLLQWIELSCPWNGVPFVAEPKWKAAHDRWIEEVLGVAPPVVRPWGRVDSVADDRSGSCQILLKYR